MATEDPATATESLVERAGERLDVYVTRVAPALTRSRAQRLIAEGRVTVDGRAAKPSLRLEPGQRVRVDAPPPAAARPAAEAMPLDVVFEDADILVVNKPPGMTVHPAPGHASATLVNAVLAHARDLSGIGGVLRPGIVHRLDRDTSGLIVVAKDDAAHNALARALAERRIEKTYLALVEGTPRPAEGVIDAPVARDPRQRKRMAVVAAGREALTEYRVVERVRGASLVEARPRTGRTHQIRVHLAAVGHAVVGDRLYGRPSPLVARQFLHAWRLAFAHPCTGERLELEAELPADLRAALAAARRL